MSGSPEEGWGSSGAATSGVWSPGKAESGEISIRVGILGIETSRDGDTIYERGYQERLEITKGMDVTENVGRNRVIWDIATTDIRGSENH